MTLAYYRNAVDAECCPYCRTALSANLWYFDHLYGFNVSGFDLPQWLYITCTKCKAQIALIKLGVWPQKEW